MICTEVSREPDIGDMDRSQGSEASFLRAALSSTQVQSSYFTIRLSHEANKEKYMEFDESGMCV